MYHRDQWVTASFELEDADGVFTEYSLTARMSRQVRGYLTGRPEDCYPDEGGEIISPLTITRGDGKVVPEAAFADEVLASMVEALYDAQANEG